MLLLNRDTACVPSAYSPTTSMSFSWCKQPDDALARHRLVVDDHRANLGHATSSTACPSPHLELQAPPSGIAMQHEQPALGGLPEFEPV